MAWGVVGLVFLSASTSIVLAPEGIVVDAVSVLAFVGFGAVGALIVSRDTGNRIGWLFLLVALGVSVLGPADAYPQYATARGLPGAVWASWVSNWAWLIVLAPMFVFFPLLFPNGRPPSPRWRPFLWGAAAYMVGGALTYALDPAVPLEHVDAPNPLGVEAFRGTAEFNDGPGLAGFIALGVASSVSLVLRFRRSDRETRQQIKWFMVAVGFLLLLLVAAALDELVGLGLPQWVVDGLFVFALLGIPAATGIAILRHRLYDIDVVINRALVFAILAGLITAAYVGIVVGIGAAVGQRGSLFLSIVATALIAVAFQPLRERARRVADRIVYGKRATPYELLSEFADRLGEAYSLDDVLPRMARLVGEGTGAARARIWLRVGATLRPAASSPPDEAPGWPMPLEGDRLPDLPEEDAAFAVRDRGEVLGALTVVLRPGESLTPAQEKLLQDLAAQAGLILRNVRLIEELRASRQRLVTAQDEERRRLERNIHDGAQQQLVALAVKLRLVESLARRDPEKAEALAGEVRRESQEALEDLRDLARGIYPPLLADQGLAAALEAQARKAALPVEVSSDGVDRYPREAEAAVYFSVLEALQNAAKYARADRATIRLAHDDGHLTFTVEDDGAGFDPATTPPGSGLQNMRDRLEALDGALNVQSAPGEGTRITGRVPVEGSRRPG
jgi:signal transduction histidine kinase